MKRRYLVNILLGALAGLFALATNAVFPSTRLVPPAVPSWLTD